MKINILGAEYTISKQSDRYNEHLKDCDGYCDWTTKEIVIECDMQGDLGDMAAHARKVMRHEIVHAFILESGLHECSEWACSEEMVDWFARQGGKIFKAWQEAGAL